MSYLTAFTENLGLSVIRLAIYVTYFLLNVFGGAELSVALIVTPLAILCFLEVVSIKERHFTVRDMFWFLMYLFFVIRPLQGVHGGSMDGG